MSNTWTYTYLPGSHLLSAVSNRQSQIVAKRAYEPNRNLLTSIETCTGETCLALSRYEYENDPLGRRTRRLDSGASFQLANMENPDSPLTTTNNFGYNVRSEVVEAFMGTNTYGYAYDPIGNRRAATNNAEILTYLSNELNQYTNISTGVPSWAPSYDPDGNMTDYGDWAFQWNGENRLVSAQKSGAGVPPAEQIQISFAYDHQGRRIRKSVTIGSEETVAHFLYDGWNLISETRTGDSQVAHTNHYTWGLDLSGSMQGAGGIGGLLSVHTFPLPLGEGQGEGSTVYPCYDANGNIVQYIDQTGTNIVAHYEYDPFGNETQRSGSAASQFRFRFSTKYHDAETGMYYYGYRYYCPELGRWPSRDPIGEMGGLNLYSAFLGDPVGLIDYLGLVNEYFHEVNTPPRTVPSKVRTAQMLAQERARLNTSHVPKTPSPAVSIGTGIAAEKIATAGYEHYKTEGERLSRKAMKKWGLCRKLQLNDAMGNYGDKTFFLLNEKALDKPVFESGSLEKKQHTVSIKAKQGTCWFHAWHTEVRRHWAWLWFEKINYTITDIDWLECPADHRNPKCDCKRK